MIKSKTIRNILYICLTATLFFLVLYFSCQDLRIYLKEKEVDPNYIIGLLTAASLIFSIIQNMQDRRHHYNSQLSSEIKSKAELIIAELLKVKQKSEKFLLLSKDVQNALDTGHIFLQSGHIFEEYETHQISIVAAYFAMYFPVQKENWNNCQDLLSEIGTISLRVCKNYSEVLPHIRNGVSFSNDILKQDSLTQLVIESEQIDKKINKITFEMYEYFMEVISKNQDDLKSSI